MSIGVTGKVGYTQGNENTTSKSNTDYSRGSAQSQQQISTLLDELNKQLMQKGRADQYSKETAISDATLLADQSMQAALDNKTIAALVGQNVGGAYNSTATRQMAADAAASAAGVRASVIQDAITRYGQIGSNQQSALIQQLLNTISASQSAQGNQATDTQTQRKYDQFTGEVTGSYSVG